MRKLLLLILVAAATLTACNTKEARRINDVAGRLFGSAGGSRGDPQADLIVNVANWASVAVDQYRAQQTHSAEEEAKAIGYERSQGTVLKVRRATVSPGTVTAGKPVVFEMDYALLSPDSKVSVSEDWEIRRNGKKLTSTPKQTQKREPGGWRARASMKLPREAKGGTYVVRNRVTAGKVSDVREARFVVAALAPETSDEGGGTGAPPRTEAPVDRKLMQVQGRLGELGHDPGSVDGRKSKKTTAALKEFQREYGLPPTGKVDAETRKALGL